MKKQAQTLLGAIALTAVLLFSACNDKPPAPPEDTTAPATAEVTTESVTQAPVDPFAAVRESDELWLSYGLTAYENQTEVQDLSEFFASSLNQSYLGLYDDVFAYDSEKTIPVAEAFFRFVCDEYGVDALLDMEKRCEYKTAYLKSLGSELDYLQSPEQEAFFASMSFSADRASKAEYPYKYTWDNVHYYFQNFNAGTISDYHATMYHATTGLRKMAAYMDGLNADDLLDTDREFHFYMTLNGGASKTTPSNGYMYINIGASALHEAVHSMGIGLTERRNVWLSEGLCNYFGKQLGFDPLVKTNQMVILRMIGAGFYDAQAAAGDQTAIQSKAAYDAYVSRGGSFNSVEEFDIKLYIDVLAKLEFEFGEYKSMGGVWKETNKSELNSIGAELSYDQATSMVHYLVDTYGIDTVLNAYRTQDMTAVFGKDYEDLKAEWLEYLYR